MRPEPDDSAACAPPMLRISDAVMSVNLVWLIACALCVRREVQYGQSSFKRLSGVEKNWVEIENKRGTARGRGKEIGGSIETKSA